MTPRRRDQAPITVTCPYCGHAAELVDSSVVYGRSYGKVWLCRPCQAWVGCHKNSRRHAPLGRLANAELRAAKQEAHAAFDRLWQAKMRHHNVPQSEARPAAYRWLAEQMGMSKADCHIGKMDVQECRRVVEICAAVGRVRA